MKQARLYVDILNWMDKFFPKLLSFNWFLHLEFVRTKAEEFVQACRNSDWHVEIFIDAGIGTEETLRKWKERREKEVRYEIRSKPPNLKCLIGEIFKELNVPVHYSVEHDLDDTIATFAHFDKASVLSHIWLVSSKYTRTLKYQKQKNSI